MEIGKYSSQCDQQDRVQRTPFTGFVSNTFPISQEVTMNGFAAAVAEIEITVGLFNSSHLNVSFGQ